MRYILQEQDTDGTWLNTTCLYETKRELDAHIGRYNIDYEYRVGYFFKHFNKPVSRFVWFIGAKKGQDVNP